MSSPREELRRQILDFYGVTAKQVEAADAVLGGPQLRERERRYRATLPSRMKLAAAEATAQLPDWAKDAGLHFEWDAG